jgi:hypothetical protein
MFHKWKVKRNMARFYRLTKGILETPPMPVVDAPWSIVSIVSHDYVQMYILALKSFYSRLGAGRIVAIADDDLSPRDRELLSHHFPGIEFAALKDVDTGPCQRGGMWERLLYLLDRSQREYVIQLDADTLTFGDISEIKKLIQDNVAFTLSGSTNPAGNSRPSDTIRPMSQIASEARQSESNYIGIVAERLFDQYPGGDALKYVRGSAAFAGLAKNGFHRSEIEQFHTIGEKLLGKRWLEWGTEQTASNFAVANSPGAVVLPYPKYANFDPDALHSITTLLHFLGSRRYVGDQFANLGSKVIEELR